MAPARTRKPSDIPRHFPRTLPQDTYTYASQISNLGQNYEYVTTAPVQMSMLATCLPLGEDAFYPHNDGSYIPASSIAPTALTFLDSITPYDIETSSRTSATSSGSTVSLSPPITEADMYTNDHYAIPDMHLGIDQFGHFSDPWATNLPLTPPADPMFDDMFCSSKGDHGIFQGLPEPTSECEYLGLSKLQFSTRTVARGSNPRPLRSASDRTPESSPTGSPKAEPLERSKNNPRSDRRYDVKADKDGFYHCPYTSEGCSHKPTKQKCIYAKNLDSHLKPYTCKHTGSEECRSLRFSSNACLFRHEREMHGLHNHGINPYLCKFNGCERARDDNGFPRRWNQRDHMKRVHGWEEPENDDAVERGYNEPARRRRGPATTSSVPMKRTSSARAHPYIQGPTRTAGAPRYSAQMPRALQAQTIMLPGMTVDPGHYETQAMMNQTYVPGLYMAGQY